MGIETGLLIGGTLLGAGANIYGARQQNNAARDATAAQNAWRQQLMQMAQPYMTPSGYQNPYAAQMLQMLSGQNPNFGPVGSAPQGGGGGGGGFGPGGGPGDPGGGVPMMGGGGDPRRQPLTVMDDVGVVSSARRAPGNFMVTDVAGPRRGGLGAASNMIRSRVGTPLPAMPNMGGMFSFQNPGAITADLASLGLAPSMQASLAQAQGLINAPTIAAPERVGFERASAAGAFSPERIGASMIGLDQLGGFPTGTQGQNAGQDGLLQMMRRDLNPTREAGLDPNLLSLAAGNSVFDNTDLFQSLGRQDARAIEEQVAQLRAGAGSLGARFGTAMNDNESRMRGAFIDNVSARNAQIQAQSFEAAQQRRMEALGIMTGREQNFNQFGLANAGMQLTAAQAAAQNALAGQDLSTQAALQARGQNLSALQSNQQAALSAAQANQGAGLNAGLQNQQLATQVALANQQAGLEAGQFNANLGSQVAQANAGLNMQGQQANLDVLTRIALANQAAQMQAGQANMQMAGQYGLAGFDAANNMSMFNAQQGTRSNEFAAQQGNIYNQLMMQGMGLANGFQQQGFQNNAALLSLMAGLPMPASAPPSAMPGAIADIGQTAALLPFMWQAMQGSQRAPALPNLPPVYYPGLDPRSLPRY